MPLIGYSHRPVALGRRGMVASAHSYATVAGLDVLRSGGTAADAAVAVNAVLGVTQPENCGVGGDIFCLYYEAATGRIHYLNGAGRSGTRASLEEMRRRGMDRLPVTGPATVSVPGCSDLVPVTCPRRPERSPATSPMVDSGQRTSRLTIGSSTIGRAFSMASRNALRPAVTKATSFESTG